jgi:hypothetical protein
MTLGQGYSFLYNGTTYMILAPPGALDSFASSISDGYVLGQYSIPEPSGLALLAIGLATTAGYFGLRRRRRIAIVRPGTQVEVSEIDPTSSQSPPRS